MEIVWKDVKGYEGLYQVSNIGTVRSISFRNNQCENKSRIKEMHPFNNGKGYMLIGFQNGGKKKNFYVHRLVAEHFCDNPNGYANVDHIDHNRSNNNCTNLEWVTQKENIRRSKHLMMHQKDKCRASSSGQKYIRITKSGFCVNVRVNKMSIAYKTFKNLKEAIEYRDEVLANVR